jgi:hypothetical protein
MRWGSTSLADEASRRLEYRVVCAPLGDALEQGKRDGLRFFGREAIFDQCGHDLLLLPENFGLVERTAVVEVILEPAV